VVVPTTVVDRIARLGTVAALAVSGVIHLRLAPNYPFPGTVTGTELFYLQGSVALALALALLVTNRPAVWAAAAMVGLGSFAAVMAYRYLDVGAIGPLPDMHDPTWQPLPDKPASAVAEAVVVALCALHLAARRRARLTGVGRMARVAGG
jgi:hypothetical protein